MKARIKAYHIKLTPKEMALVLNALCLDQVDRPGHKDLAELIDKFQLIREQQNF
jgi:hypothetical protein